MKTYSINIEDSKNIDSIELRPLLSSDDEVKNNLLKKIKKENQTLLKEYSDDVFWKNFRQIFYRLEDSLNKLSPHQNAVILRAMKTLLLENEKLSKIFADNKNILLNQNLENFSNDKTLPQAACICMLYPLIAAIVIIVTTPFENKDTNIILSASLFALSALLCYVAIIGGNKSNKLHDLYKLVDDNKNIIRTEARDIFSQILDVYNLNLLFNEVQNDLSEFPQDLKNLILEFCDENFFYSDFGIIIEKIFDEELEKGLSIEKPPSVLLPKEDEKLISSEKIIFHNNNF